MDILLRSSDAPGLSGSKGQMMESRRIGCSLTMFTAFLILSSCHSVLSDDVAGPTVQLSDIRVSGTSDPAKTNATSEQEEHQSSGVAALVSEAAKEVAREVDKTLTKEFGNATLDADGKSFAAALNSTNADGSTKAETVVRIHSSSHDHDHPLKSSNSSSSDASADTVAAPTESEMDKAVDRIIDQHDNEFVLSKSGSTVSALTLDPQLITDLSLILGTSAILGALFEAIRQPVINGYLMAGALLGPGGLNAIKELVQVESISQLGVFLLLFGLGMELNFTKLHSVAGVTVIGGSLQIMICMLTGAFVSAWLLDSPVAPGIFTGALIAMSSTSVVVKCLEATRSLETAYGTITVGTLILQDCWVGVLFALLPLFKPLEHVPVKAAQTVQPNGTTVGGGDRGRHLVLEVVQTALRGLLEEPSAQGDSNAERSAAVVLAVLKALFKIAFLSGMSVIFARVVMSHLLRLLIKHGSQELNQVMLVSFCLGCTWAGGKFGISEELGAFVGGAMVSAAASASVTLCSQGGSPIISLGSAHSKDGEGGCKLLDSRSSSGGEVENLASSDGVSSGGKRLVQAAGGGLGGRVSAFRYPGVVAGAVAGEKKGDTFNDKRAAQRHLDIESHVSLHTSSLSFLAPAGSKLGSVNTSGLLTSISPHLQTAAAVVLAGASVVSGAAEVSTPRSAAAQAKAAEDLSHMLRRNIDSVHNVLTALFLASTALIISPTFLWSHAKVLAISTLLVMFLKAFLVAGTVLWFGYPWRTAWAIGVTMAHIGEFSFVLLSASSQLDILPHQMYQLLLGVTALSLLTTPVVIMACNKIFKWGGLGMVGNNSRTPLMTSESDDL
ncbi:hypothetical protein CEUSTIGMA_g11423.t1 [Chlamydomonas eustigma]|uniref:Cation/H+ exchanger transmembrane domain-containing protein n=1 Tax=Chlamydomonas eustigma TaxID=1157962 RepID=A0A250XLP6_9CHLO|nr:hypothetical protein CEUSTIGMA_g11423.t1 [Chlamydomonas eustigma]|eukprot:GAX83998.1 hypothetical protein CEUSTIGMA_g11423.t1 [Chlamydomonas eustigma]